MATITAFASKRKLGKLTRVILTVRDSEDELGTGKSYELEDVVADSTNIEQADPTINETECETSDDNIYESVTLGKYSVTLNSAVIPDELLTDAFGYTLSSDGNLYAPASYTAVWCKFEFAFDSSDDTIVIPKVKVNTKVTGASLKTGLVLGAISGTAYKETISVGEEGSETTIKSPFYIHTDGKASLPAAV